MFICSNIKYAKHVEAIKKIITRMHPEAVRNIHLDNFMYMFSKEKH